MKTFASAFFIFLPFSFLSAQNIEPEWVRMEATDGNDMKVFFDNAGNVITLGETYHPGPVLGMVTMKYDPEGNLLWANKYDTYTTERIKDCIADAEGSVYSLCSSIDPSNNLSRFALVKYSAEGDTLWTFYYGGSQFITNAAADILPADDGNILLVGSVQFLDVNDYGLMLLKISPAGEIIWEAIYTEGPYGFSGLGARLVDGVYYVWGRNGSAEGARFCCMTVETNGVIADFNVTEPYSDYFDTYYNLDLKGNFLVGDHCCQYKITKYSSKGDKLWQYIKPVEPDTFGPNVAVARLTSINVDSANNVYAAGPYFVNDTINKVILTTKINEGGTIIWQKAFISPEIFVSSPAAMRILDNKVTIGGEADAFPPLVNAEFLLLQYDLDGNLLIGGRSDIEGNKNFARGLAVYGNVVMIGGVWNPDTVLLQPTRQIVAKYLLPTSSITPTPGQQQSIKIVPNPFHESVGLLLPYEGLQRHGVLQVYDGQGRILYEQTIALAQGDNFIEIDRFRDFSPGLYYFKIQAGRDLHISKAIKMN